MKKTFEEIRSLHLNAVDKVMNYLTQKSDIHFYLVESDEYLDDKFERLTREYSSYRDKCRTNSFNFKRASEKERKRSKKIVEALSERKYVESNLKKNIAYDHLLYGDIRYISPLYERKVSIKIVSGKFLRRWAIHRYKGEYIIMCNSEDVGKSKVIKKENAKAYFDGIYPESKWLLMPSKKRTKVVQNFEKFENFCYLEDFCNMYLLYLLSENNQDDDEVWRKVYSFEKNFFLHRTDNKRIRKQLKEGKI